MSSTTSENHLTETPKNDVMKTINSVKKESILSGFLRLWPLGVKHDHVEATTPDSCDLSTTYYGVYVPCENEDTLHIYTERNDALKVVKKCKHARFKVFKNRQQAVAFALQGAEPVVNDKLPSDGPSLTLINNEKLENGKQPSSSSPAVGEQTSQFKGPKPQEMVKLRKEIENGSLEIVHGIFWGNPRYLVSSGDTPSILHEGMRYNALHIATKAGNVEICNLILSTIADPAFIQILYGEDDLERCKDRATILLDLYINTPDKAMNDTPLHLAVKFGFIDVVDFLTSYPQCNKNNKNKFGYFPRDVICERAKKTDATIVSRIATLLSDRFYVPVIHSEGDCDQPVIGNPFNPKSPPQLNKDPLSPRLEIRAYAGPMPKQEADSFRKKWKTPPRQLREPRFRLNDVDKGLEKYGRNLAQELNVGWKEYWPFLDTFTDLTSEEGLKLLEEFFDNKYTDAYSQVFASSAMSASVVEHIADENISHGVKRKLSFTENENAEDDALSPISDLCMALKACSLAECNNRYVSKCKVQLKYDLQVSLESREPIPIGFPNPSLSPFLCVERSCQVFVKRLTDYLICALTSDLGSLLENLKSETKHLQQTVMSYMDDARFAIVDFHLIHSRVAELTACRFRQQAECEEDVATIAKNLEDLQKNCKRNSDVLSSDDEDNMVYRQNHRHAEQMKVFAQTLNEHVRCLAEKIAVSLKDDSLKDVRKTAKTEEESVSSWAGVHKCSCSWQQVGLFVRNCRKTASFKRNYLRAFEEGRGLRSKSRQDEEHSGNILSSSPNKSTTERLLSWLHGSVEDNTDVKHCVTITPNCTDRNHNSSLVELKQTWEPTSSTGNIDRLENSRIKEIHSTQSLQDKFEDILSDDESDGASHHQSGDQFFTPPSSPRPNANEDNCSDSSSVMHDVTDDGAVDIFIYGDAPSKTDQDVFDATSKCTIDCETYPNLYRWRHNISMYPDAERLSWQPVVLESPTGPIQSCNNLGSLLSSSTPVPTSALLDRRQRRQALEHRVLTPPSKTTQVASLRADSHAERNGSAPSLQMASWLRVTGRNSPKSALANKKLRSNISLEF